MVLLPKLLENPLSHTYQARRTPHSHVYLFSQSQFSPRKLNQFVDPHQTPLPIITLSWIHIRSRRCPMNFSNRLGDKAIQDVMQDCPEVGEILARYDIGCTTCKVGICLLKDVVSIHGLSKEDETKIEQEINEHLAKKGE